MRVMAKLKTVIELDYLLANTKKKKKSVNGRYMNTPPQKKKERKKKDFGNRLCIISFLLTLFVKQDFFFPSGYSAVSSSYE